MVQVVEARDSLVEAFQRAVRLTLLKKRLLGVFEGTFESGRSA
jgi:hypothetical protein